MTSKPRKKNIRQRGNQTHGWGSKKKHRGAGNRGGKGMAGTGKRGDAKKPSIWKDDKYFGKHGFIKKNIKIKIHAINIKTLDQSIPSWLASKKAEQKDGYVTIDLANAGYNKLLSNGSTSRKLKISTPYASAAAVKKIKAAGGSVEGLAKAPEAKEEKKEQ